MEIKKFNCAARLDLPNVIGNNITLSERMAQITFGAAVQQQSSWVLGGITCCIKFQRPC